jgi:hypothetical protein
VCGGPSSQQKQAASSQAQLSAEELATLNQTLPTATSFYANEVAQGLPYFAQESQYSTSNLAKQINQARAAQKAKLAGYGGALPSGFASASDRDMALGGAEAFDQNFLNLLNQQQAAKQAGAGGLTGIASTAGGTAAGANQSIMQAPLQNNFWSNLVSGLVQGAGNIPFAFA